jgi:outer membrane protein OmpA-like peptidoglycan-associated protein
MIYQKIYSSFFRNGILLLFCLIIINSNSLTQGKLSVSVIEKSKKIELNAQQYNAVDSSKLIITPFYKDGKQVPDLKPENIIIKKKNKIANIVSVTSMTETEEIRTRVLLLVDNSSSMSPYKKEVILILNDLIKNLGKGVVISVCIFDSRNKNEQFKYEEEALPINLLKFTTDRDSINYFYESAYESTSSQTYLYDEIYVGLEYLKSDSTNVDNTVAIILSDGEDIGSSVSKKYLLNRDLGNTVIYAVDFMPGTSERRRSREFLLNLSKMTNGEYYSPKDISGLSAYFQKIATKITNKGYLVEYKFPDLNPSLICEYPQFDKSTIPENLTNFEGLVIQEIDVKESFPLLNYIFFDSERCIIPYKYRMFKTSSETKSFSESEIDGGALPHYYNILNIIGERMVKNPAAKITLIGCNDGSEKGGRELSFKRMMSVKYYFESIWKIHEGRIKYIAKNLPEKPSTPKTTEGKSENRRVEIQCSDWNIMKPVTFKQKTNRLLPPNVLFSIGSNLNAEDRKKAGIAGFSVKVQKNNADWNILELKENEDKIIYDWKDKDGMTTNDENTFEMFAKVMDKGDDIYFTDKKSIKVKQILQKKTATDTSIQGNIEKVSLVLFDFGKFDLGVKNDSIMREFVYPRIVNSGLYVVVNGYTDIMGSDEVNKVLSEKRAKSVHAKIKNKLPFRNTSFKGYGASKPIFDNNLPEGRFYNRTVQLLIQNFPPETAK